MYVNYVNLNSVINVIHIFSIYDVTDIVRQVHIVFCIIIIVIILNWNVGICRKIYFNKLISYLMTLLLLLLLYDMDVSCHRPLLPCTSLEPAVIPTAQASSFTLQYFPYYYYYYYYYY